MATRRGPPKPAGQRREESRSRGPKKKSVAMQMGSPPSWTWGDRLVGVHCSTAGGLVTGIARGAALGCTAIQLFTKNNNRWLAPPLAGEEIRAFLTAWTDSPIRFIMAHAGYLINLASPDQKITEQSMESMRTEILRAEMLKIPFLVIHPGSHKGTSEGLGIRYITDRLNILLDESTFSNTRILFEGTAGQGQCIGHRFEHLRDLLAGVRDIDRVGICLDTAHLFAAGYDFRTASTYAAMWEQFEAIVGLKWLYALHLNDTTRELGARVDRHSHIGEGMLGARAFGFLMRDERLHHLPMVCETPKGKTDVEDRTNLEKLYRMTQR